MPSWDIVSRLLFPAPAPSYGPDSFPEELIYVPKILELQERCPPEQCIPCLFLKYPSARFLIFYLHSNAEDIGKCYSFCHVLREQFQVHVLAVEYPGYGMCPGGPATADSVTENAFVAFRFVREVLRWPCDSIMIFGRSIGTGPAVALAVQYKVSGLILIAPFLSIKDLLRDTVGVLSYLVEERFPSKDRMCLVRSPALIIHGQKDSLIPCKHGTALYELCRSRKLLVCPQSMEHNTNLLSDVAYLVVPMLQFFALPDYCFEEISAPAWAYERRLPTAATERSSRSSERQGTFPSCGASLASLRESTKVVIPAACCSTGKVSTRACEAPAAAIHGRPDFGDDHVSFESAHAECHRGMVAVDRGAGPGPSSRRQVTAVL